MANTKSQSNSKSNSKSNRRETRSRREKHAPQALAPESRVRFGAPLLMDSFKRAETAEFLSLSFSECRCRCPSPSGVLCASASLCGEQFRDEWFRDEQFRGE
jgi:hypothetical protein